MYANGKDTAVRNEANGGALNSLVVWIEEKKLGTNIFAIIQV